MPSNPQAEPLAATASSSSQSPRTPTPQPDHDQDELDFLGDDIGADRRVLEETPISFKRKQADNVLSTPNRLLSAITGGRSSHAGNGSSSRDRSPSGRMPFFGSQHKGNGNALNHNTKDGVPLDWHVEGPGRRVGYDDLTAIDWIFEYTKERQRIRTLTSGASGMIGRVQVLLDSSQAWIVLVLTGLLVGAIAATINVTTDWLGDIKLGFCSSGPEGGHFYLNKAFCCFGYDQGSKCLGWKTWSDSLGVHSTGGKWFLEYIFFLLFSVRNSPTLGYGICC